MAMDIKTTEVKQWLEDIFGGIVNVPDFEKTSPSINILHQLMMVSRQADVQAQALAQDYTVRAQEYAAKEEQKASALKCIGLSIENLGEDVQTALCEMSQAAVIVDAAVPSEGCVMLGCTRLEARHYEVSREADAGDHLRSQLVSLSQQLAQKMQHAQMLERQVEAALALERRELESNKRRELFHEKKLAEYEKDIRNSEAELQLRGHSGSITHDSVMQLWRELQQLQRQVRSLREELESYSALPPDLSAARLEVQRCRQQLSAIVSDMAAQQGQGFTS